MTDLSHLTAACRGQNAKGWQDKDVSTMLTAPETVHAPMLQALPCAAGCSLGLTLLMALPFAAAELEQSWQSLPVPSLPPLLRAPWPPFPVAPSTRSASS